MNANPDHASSVRLGRRDLLRLSAAGGLAVLAGLRPVPAGAQDKTVAKAGQAVVIHVDAAHPDRKIVQAGIDGKQVILPPEHPASEAAHRTGKYADARPRRRRQSAIRSTRRSL